MSAVVHIAGLAVELGGQKVISGVDIGLRGGITSVVGPNGAGKSSLLRCLATVVDPAAGRVAVDGLVTTDDRGRTEIRRRLGYLPQLGGLPGRARVFDAVDHFAVLKELAPEVERDRRVMVWEALELVEMTGHARHRVKRLSGGERQRVRLAIALLGRPSLLVLDEPATALDPDQRRRLDGILAERAAATTVVQASHLIAEAGALSDRMLVMADGRVVFDGSPSEMIGDHGDIDAAYRALVARCS